MNSRQWELGLTWKYVHFSPPSRKKSAFSKSELQQSQLPTLAGSLSVGAWLCVCPPWAADVWDSTFCVQMSVRWGRAVLDNAAGALSDTHRGTQSTALPHGEWSHRGLLGCEHVQGSVREQSLLQKDHCVHLPTVCQALTSLSAHGHRAEQRKWFNEVKPREEFFCCSFACLVVSPLSSIPLSLSWDCSGQEVKGCHFSSGWCLMCCSCTSRLCFLQRWCLPGFGIKINLLYGWNMSVFHTEGVEEWIKKQGWLPALFCCLLCPEGEIDLPVPCHSTGGREQSLQTDCYTLTGSWGHFPSASQQNWLG